MPIAVTAHGFRFEVHTAGHLPTAPRQVEPAVRVLQATLLAMGAPRVSALHARDASTRFSSDSEPRPPELLALEAEAARAIQGPTNPRVLLSAV